MKKILFMLITLLTISAASAQTDKSKTQQPEQSKTQKDKTAVDKNRKMADTTATIEKRKAKQTAKKTAKPGKNDPNSTGSGMTPDTKSSDSPARTSGQQPASGSVPYPDTPKPADNKTVPVK